MAVIRGGATTNNGFNVNMPATSKDGQIEVLRQAYNDANVSPSEVNYIEAHGTGTRLGDPVESNSLGEFFSASKEKDNPLLVGSIKTNLGHSESASGIAGALKAIMICQNRVIPKNINFKNPNPKIDFEKLNLKVPTENIAWPSDCQETIKAGGRY
jgi:acyl transferase domain-containing protein